MKKIFTLIIISSFTLVLLNAQDTPPQAFSYKATITKSNGAIIANKTIGLKISILDSYDSPVYIETHNPTTNEYGQIDIVIGQNPDPGYDFTYIDWSSGTYYLKTEMDAKGGTDYSLMSVAQLLSVPYALYSGEAANSFSGYYIDLIGTPVLSLVAETGSYYDLYDAPINLSEFNNDLTFITNETDPVFLSHDANSITNTSINNWNTAFGWGNHSGLYRPISYVPDWSEITENPFSFDSPEDNQLLRYNSGKWESWTPDFLTAEVDGSITNELQNLTLDGHELTITEGSTITLPDEVDDGDYDPENELISELSLSGTNLEITEASATKSVDLSSITSSLTLAGILTNENDAGLIPIINLGDPMNEQDAATKSYVDQLESRIAQLEVVVANLVNLESDDDNDGYTIADGDCNDNDGSIYPGAPEICGDGIDQDCDGEDLPCSGADTDDDHDGYTENQGDCNDADPDIYPGAEEICGDGIDQDCDGIDEPCPDNDGDGYSIYEDCNDNDQTIYPGAPEICGDGIDQDCDGEDLPCIDNDGDGWPEQEDCNDNDRNIYPGAPEICNGRDDNCDGLIDNNPVDGDTYYRDADGDGYGVEYESIVACNNPGPGEYSLVAGDCDDSAPDIHPGAIDICGDGIDQDCDGEDPECTTCIDWEGNEYQTVQIGDQLWIAENLKSKYYNDGISISEVTNPADWIKTTTPAYCWFNNDPDHQGNVYGALYNWYAVNTGKLCPVGWHVPTESEWITLANYLGGESIAGGKLKETGTFYWVSPNAGATNESGFTALPGGYRYVDGGFYGLGTHAYFWSATEEGASSAHSRFLYYLNSSLSQDINSMIHGFSVRCIKDQ